MLYTSTCLPSPSSFTPLGLCHSILSGLMASTSLVALHVKLTLLPSNVIVLLMMNVMAGGPIYTRDVKCHYLKN